MSRWKKRQIAVLLLSVGTWVSGEQTMALEGTPYRIIREDGGVELREYAPHIVAETVVDGDFEEVGNVGFRRFYDYISGKNRRGDSIPMTAPVNQVRAGGSWRVTFLMPSSYTMETLPLPLDTTVQLRQISARRVAALRYGGRWGRERFEANKVRLEAWIRAQGLRPADEPIFARYDPPFMPWFLRRNEILIPVETGSP